MIWVEKDFMTVPAYAAVDWGTSSFRLWLMDANDNVLAERRSGEGMTTAARTGFADVLDFHLGALTAPADMPVVICGMAGARQGWIEAGYVDVPAPLTAILSGAVRIPGEQRDIRILPGLAQRSTASPDVMRGEETQLLGALDTLGDGDQIVCMPGTHSKWVHVSDGTVTRFSTFMTGELFEVISKHSILSHAVDAADGDDEDAFADGAEAAFQNPALATSLLFAVRAGQLLHGMTATQARAKLSGTLIGLEIAGALQDSPNVSGIGLVASGKLQSLYEVAFRRLDLSYTVIDADTAVRRGLSVAAKALWQGEER